MLVFFACVTPIGTFIGLILSNNETLVAIFYSISAGIEIKKEPFYIFQQLKLLLKNLVYRNKSGQNF